MAKLSVEIPAGRAESMNVSIHMEGSGKNILRCLWFLSYSIAKSIGIPVQALFTEMAERSDKLKSTIQEECEINKAAIKQAMEGGGGK